MSAIPTTVGIESVNSDSVATPAQVFFEWNTATHVQDNEQSPAKRAFTKRELQDFFDHADDQVALIAASGARGARRRPRGIRRGVADRPVRRNRGSAVLWKTPGGLSL